MTTPPTPLLIYQTDDGRIRIAAQVQADTLWLTQQQMAQLFQTTQQNISLHLQNVYDEGELQLEATHKDFLLVRQEGSRQVSRQTRHYNLDAILSVGYCVKGTVATRFRIWATQQLREYFTKGFLLDHSHLGAALLPKNHRHLRHQHRLRPHAAAKHSVFSNGTKQAAAHAEGQYAQFNLERACADDALESDFDRAMAALPVVSPSKPKPPQHLNTKTNPSRKK